MNLVGPVRYLVGTGRNMVGTRRNVWAYDQNGSEPVERWSHRVARVEKMVGLRAFLFFQNAVCVNWRIFGKTAIIADKTFSTFLYLNRSHKFSTLYPM